MANIKDYLKRLQNGNISLEEQQKLLSQVEETIKVEKQKRDEAVGQKADMVVQALKNIEAKLEAKLVELNNTPAKQGVPGPQGPAGRDGRDGVDGYKGADGRDGVDGKDGKDGKDGISVTDAQIDFDGSLVIKLSDGSEIDAGQVVPAETAKLIHAVSTNGGGTSQSVLDAIDAINATIATYGTMALQNANNVNISGGAVNNTTIGATTPNTGTFTTLTAQTEVLKGTGQNFVLYSQTIANASWAKFLTTLTDNATTAPDGTTTADYMSATNPSAAYPTVSQAFNCATNQTYTFSIYVKAAEQSTVSFQVYGNSTTYINGINVSLTSSWQRIQLTINSASYTSLQIRVGFSGSPVTWTGTQGIYIWGAQAELASTAGTYIATTTTAVYGTPSLSFSGVSSIGLQSDGSLYVQPAGTGAIQAQATTSSATGGNARGANAVDWQTSRSTAAQVASAAQSVVGGGSNNTSSGAYSTIVGGNANQTSGYGSFIGGGYNSTASGSYATLVGGYQNNSTGILNFIGGGQSNSGTALAAVTTQATTAVTSGSTAVTLSGSNANIKVGQLITGTGINSFTYVAAISGTSLTLSQNATASGSPTLSFFTPHGVVVGGGNNQATGAYSFIGGGGDAGTAGNRNVASGTWSSVLGGVKNTASGDGAVVCGGGLFDLASGGVSPNTASGLSSFIGGGFGNSASSNAAGVLCGVGNVATGIYSSVVGGTYGTTRGISCNIVLPAANNPIAISPFGVSQSAVLILGRQTTDATATVLASTASAASTTNQVILPNNSAYYFRGEIVAGVTGGGNTKGWFIEGVIKRGATAASTAMVGTATVTSNYADVGAATWTVAVAADTTNGGLKITVTGAAATTIRWVAQVRTTEMTY